MTPNGVRIALRDVAREAGVSTSIASRVINSDPTVAVRDETRQRILDVAKRLRYRPNAAARGIREGRARAFGMLIPSLTEPVYARIVRGAMARANEFGVVLLVVEDPDTGSMRTIALEMQARMIDESRIDGLLISSIRPGHPVLTNLAEAALPHVFVNRASPGSHRNVRMKDDKASRLAVQHLAGLGHTRIAHLAGPRRLDPSMRRAVGFRSAMRDLGESSPSIVHSRFTSLDGMQGAARLLAVDPKLTAIYTSNFSQALGALAQIRETGRRIPHDISLITYDDLPVADVLDPPLTTIRMPLEELGAAGVDALLAQMRGEVVDDHEIDSDPIVIVRSSTARPRSGAPIHRKRRIERSALSGPAT